MRAVRLRRRLSLPTALAALLLGAVAITLALLALGTGRAPSAAAEGALPELTPYTDVAVPAEKVVMLGATPAEPGAPAGVTWGLGELGEGKEAVPELVRYVPPSEADGSVEAGGWEPVPNSPPASSLTIRTSCPAPWRGR